MAPIAARAELEQAAAANQRATRSRIAADLDSTRALRRSIQTIWGERPQNSDGIGLTMLVDAALTAVAFTLHWHRTRQHAQQEAAAEQVLLHLQTAYAQTVEPVLVGLAQPGTRPADQAALRPRACHIAAFQPRGATRIRFPSGSAARKVSPNPAS
ncbi:hypothetical protein [Streptomyces sp. NPDC003015]